MRATKLKLSDLKKNIDPYLFNKMKNRVKSFESINDITNKNKLTVLNALVKKSGTNQVVLIDPTHEELAVFILNANTRHTKVLRKNKDYEYYDASGLLHAIERSNEDYSNVEFFEFEHENVEPQKNEGMYRGVRYEN